MPSAICPYLGLIDDPDTCLAFPTERNSCQRTIPVESISLEHQSSYCLTYKYTECPIYKGGTLPAMNADRAKARRSQLLRRGCIVVWLVVILIGIAALIPFLSNYQRSQALQSGPANSENVLSIPTAEASTPTEVQASQALEQVSSTLAPSATLLPSPTRCILPAGWVPYVLTPEDNLNNIAGSVGLTILELQQANCGADLSSAHSGDAIFLPFIPTLTPAPTPTPTQAQQLTPTSTIIAIIIIDTNTPTPSLTPVPATATRYVPPTATKKPPKNNPPPSRPTSTPPDTRP